jgi:hypothetical protein
MLPDVALNIRLQELHATQLERIKILCAVPYKSCDA